MNVAAAPNLTMSLFTLLTLLLGGGGRDLLDYVPGPAFWQARGVPLTVDALTAELSPQRPDELISLVKQLADKEPERRRRAAEQILDFGPEALPALATTAAGDEPEAAGRAAALIRGINEAPRRKSVRRLMALRTLGELKLPEARDVLRRLRDSHAPFESDYARAALAALGALDGAEPATTRAANTETDFELLPESCGAVICLRRREGHTLNPAEIESLLPLPPGQERIATADRLAAAALSAAEQLGDMRVDSVTVGLSQEVSDRSGFVIVVAHGQYESAGFEALALRARITSRLLGGRRAFEPDGETVVLLPSDERAVVLGSPAGKDFPVKELVAALESGHGTIRANGTMSKLLDAADKDRPAWGVAQITPAYRKLDPLAAFTSLSLSGRWKGDRLHLELSARGDDAQRVKAATDQIAALTTAAAEAFSQLTETMAGARIAADFLRSVHCDAGGGAAEATAEVPATASAVLMNMRLQTR